MYHPISSNDDDEYIELYNSSSNAVNVGDWQFTDGVGYVIPSGAVIAAGGIRPGCAVDLVRKTAVRWLHLSARRPTPGPSRVLSPGVPPGSATSAAPGERWIMDPALVEELRSELDRQAG